MTTCSVRCTPTETPQLPGPHTEFDPFHDPFVMFGYLAGITERIGFATGVLVLTQRQTALVYGLEDPTRKPSTGPPGSRTASSSSAPAASTTPSMPGRRCAKRVSSLGRSVEDFGAEYVTLSHGVDDLTSDAETWRAAGGTHMAIATMGLGMDSADAHVDYIASAASVLSRRGYCIGCMIR
jgi:hypothetical protein